MPQRGTQDVWVDGLIRVEIMGDIARVLLWNWQFVDGNWQKTPIRWAQLWSLHALPTQPHNWPGVEVVELGGRPARLSGAISHSPH